MSMFKESILEEFKSRMFHVTAKTKGYESFDKTKSSNHQKLPSKFVLSSDQATEYSYDQEDAADELTRYDQKLDNMVTTQQQTDLKTSPSMIKNLNERFTNIRQFKQKVKLLKLIRNGNLGLIDPTIGQP